MKNVLFLLIDCLRADRCLGTKGSAKTPTIDFLRQKGTTFSNAISTASFTLPSVASLLTGTYPFVHGIKDNEPCLLNPNIKTLPEIFKENGYNTYAEVTGPLTPKFGFNRGFDRYEYMMSFRYRNLYSRWGESFRQKLKDRKFDEPWFLFVHFFELHQPRTIEKDFDKKDFGRNRYDRALSCLDAHLGEILKHIAYENTVIVFTADHGEKIGENIFREHYNTLFHYVNRYYHKLYRISRFLRRLTKNHPVHRLDGHGFHLYDIFVKVPLIFVGGGIFPENRLISDQVRQIDILPTIVDALKLDNDPDFEIHGRSLLPLIRNKKAQEIPAYIQSSGEYGQGKKLEGIRTSQYKFIYAPYNDRISPELYDLVIDPEEKRNMAKEKTEVVRDLKRRLLEIQSDDLGISLPESQKISEEDKQVIEERLKKLGYL